MFPQTYQNQCQVGSLNFFYSCSQTNFQGKVQQKTTCFSVESATVTTPLAHQQFSTLILAYGSRINTLEEKVFIIDPPLGETCILTTGDVSTTFVTPVIFWQVQPCCKFPQERRQIALCIEGRQGSSHAVAGETLSASWQCLCQQRMPSKKFGTVSLFARRVRLTPGNSCGFLLAFSLSVAILLFSSSSKLF